MKFGFHLARLATSLILMLFVPWKCWNSNVFSTCSSEHLRDFKFGDFILAICPSFPTGPIPREAPEMVCKNSSTINPNISWVPSDSQKKLGYIDSRVFFRAFLVPLPSVFSEVFWQISRLLLCYKVGPLALYEWSYTGVINPINGLINW